MTTRIADEYEYIKARMEEIKAERAIQHDEAPAEPKEATSQIYLGWDIYAPYCG